MNQPAKGAQRLYSLDALRGFDMFWIIGFGHILEAYSKTKASPFWQFVHSQVTHKYWDGFSFWDLIFPLFMFMVGVAIPFSLGRSIEKGIPRGQLLKKVLIRGIVLIALGIIYNNRLELRPIAEIRFPSVLGKIGASYLLAAIIYLYAGRRSGWIWFVSLLVGYWLLLKFTSAPGYPMGDLSEPGNFMSYFDRSVLPGRLSRGIHDTVGLLCTLTGVCTVLFGVFAGDFLKNHQGTPMFKLRWMVVAGLLSLAVAFIWNMDFPFNKNLWSSSFVLLTSGLSILLFAVFYYIIDIRGWKKWSFFFRVIGVNSILAYLSEIFIDWHYSANAFFKWLGQLAGEPYDKVVLGFCALLIQWLFLYFLYKKKIFFKV